MDYPVIAVVLALVAIGVGGYLIHTREKFYRDFQESRRTITKDTN